jgi:enamine deaminase RidA (YjgF/YER057c/UK114 family)
MSVESVNPPGWPAPKGFANGMIGRGRVLHVAGQIGTTGGGADFLAQFGAALDNVVAVVRAGGGAPGDIAEMTIYVTSITEYRDTLRELGPIWKARMGRHYPAMALVAVAALVAPDARVEIQAVAYLPEEHA